MFFFLIVQIPCKGTGTELDLTGMTQTLSEEFDGGSLDFSVWRNYPGKPRKGGYWGMEQVSVRDGNLYIRTEYKENGSRGAGYYSMGIDTMGVFEQRYGYFECRAILPPAKGLWAAFWLHCANAATVTGTGETGTEIDVFESPFYNLGPLFRNKITCNLHYNGYELKTKYKNVGIFNVSGDPYKEYHTYGLMWTPDEYIFYIDGHETGRSNFGGVSNVKEYLRLSVEVDEAESVPTPGWSGKITNNGDGVLPVDYIVDYVRVWQFNKYIAD